MRSFLSSPLVVVGKRPKLNPQSPGPSWFEQREATFLLFSSIPCLVVRSART
jgi:hypothetical protein